MNEQNSKVTEDRDQTENAVTRETRREKTCYEKLLIGGGLILCFVSALYVVLQIARCPWPTQNLCCTYIALGVIPLGLGLFLLGGSTSWITKRRTVEPSELERFYSEIERYRSRVDEDTKRKESLQQADCERDRLKNLGRPVLEGDLLTLLQILADLYYPEEELISQVRAEVDYLEYISDPDDEGVKESAERAGKCIDSVEGGVENGEEENQKRLPEFVRRLRAELKDLREKSSWYLKTWAVGEILKGCMTYWVCVTAIVTLLVGIMPVIHTAGNSNICIVHWAVLGITGAMLSILLRLDKLDVPELGESDAKDLIQGSIRSIAIGALTAVLLYAAISGRALEGKMFPKLSKNFGVSQAGQVEEDAEYERSRVVEEKVEPAVMSSENVGLSIFWAVFAGLSPRVLIRMSKVAESSLGEAKSESGGE